MQNKLRLSQKHPFWFGVMLIVAAMALFAGAVAAVHIFDRGPGDSSSSFGSWGKGKIGIVHIKGMIMEARPVTDWIDVLERDPSIRGVLIRINSPGGAVAPSQEMFQAVKRLAKVKPVVASMNTVAASGGYYVACAAPTIVANPGTLTASIGVKAELTSFEELMKKLGIEEQTITSGRLKNAGTPFRAMSPEERVYLQALVDDMHAQFVADVAEGRKMDLTRVQVLADGRAMTGRQAFEAGLVDVLGGFDDALSLLKKKCGISGDVEFVEGPEEEVGFLTWLLGSLTLRVEGLSGSPRLELKYE